MLRTSCAHRSPAIRSIGEVGLDRDGTQQEYQELVGSMLKEVNRLTRLVDDLLMISRGDSGAIQLHYSEVAVLSLARETVTLLEPLAEEKEQRLVLAGDAEATVNADPVFLRQALINVLHNAIKYSPPRATTSVRVEREKPHSVTISVHDAGPGIAPEHATRIFDRFYRIEDRADRAKRVDFGLASQSRSGRYRPTKARSAYPAFAVREAPSNYSSGGQQGLKELGSELSSFNAASRQNRGVVNMFHGRAARKVVGRFREALQNGADGNRLPDVRRSYSRCFPPKDWGR